MLAIWGDCIMTITGRTRKILWGRSGNRCAICKQLLVIKDSSFDADSVVGEECHIISEQEFGPRSDSTFDRNFIDTYDNLLLLCSIHHKLIDDHWKTYTVDVLHEIKANHEKWVSDKLCDHPKKIAIKRKEENIPEYLMKVESGKELYDILFGAHAFVFDNDELDTDDEVEVIGVFFQSLQNYVDLSSDLEAYDRVSIGYKLTNEIKKLEQIGFWVFGGTENQELVGGDLADSNWKVSIVQVLRATNDSIQKMCICADGSNAKET